MQIVMTPMGKEAAGFLAENLLASEVFLRYQQALDELNADTGAQAVPQSLSALQASQRQQESASPLSQAEFDGYQRFRRRHRLSRKRSSSCAAVPGYVSMPVGTI